LQKFIVGVIMNQPLVECIPNFSEAIRPDVVEAIVKAIKAVEHVVLLDCSSDDDHNRSVVTFVGSPEGVEEAAFRGIAKAAELIDMEDHHGAHPRIGAADVVPFVPIYGVSIDDCVEIAHRTGRRVADQLGIPVYFYERAAMRPERRNLETLRKGEYEVLKSEIVNLPDRKPDLGPSILGSAGATVIGARHPLVAYNVYLNTDDVTIAKKVARAVRHSSGGLRYIKALGMLVDGRAQVSMNLTNFRKTPIFRVVELIRREAARYGVDTQSSELIGLIPEDALLDSACWYLQFENFSPDMVLENRIRTALVEQKGDKISYLDSLASRSPTPGGGSAAAYTGALAAALVAMVARLTLGRKKYQDVEHQMKTTLESVEVLREKLNSAVEKDSKAFEDVMAAFKLPKESVEEKSLRKKAIEQATITATQVPLEVAKNSIRVMELAMQVVEMGNINAITDGGTGATLAQAALVSAGMNVRINAASLEDKGRANTFLDEIVNLESHAASLANTIQTTLVERGGLNY
jgi:glutamate formiminotransferase/formiminotetrahydrofolate cyclodeaminase